MNIDSLLNLNLGVFAHTADGKKIRGEVTEILEEDFFIFSTKEHLGASEGTLIRISDGQDSVLAKVTEVSPGGFRMSIECYASPGNERRQDVRIYDKVCLHAKFLCHSDKRIEALPEAMERIRANKLIIDSFLKGKYGYTGSEEASAQRDSSLQHSLWELNRKLDLLIHMYLAEDFMALMKTPPRDVNISASGIRFISKEPFAVGDLLEINLILPMAPLLFLRLVGDVIRIKPVTCYEVDRYAVALRFLQVDADTREDVIRYLFKRQREVLRKRQA